MYEACQEIFSDDNYSKHRGSVTLLTDPSRFAGRLDRDDNLCISLSAVLPTVERSHPEGVNTLTLRIQRLCVLNVTLETGRDKRGPDRKDEK